MAQIAVLERKCDGCGECVDVCPFGGIEIKGTLAEFTAGCRVCGICLKKCPQGALVRLEAKKADVDKGQWRDILVVAELSSGKLHPVSMELIGKALSLSRGAGVDALVMGFNAMDCAKELLHYGVRRVYLYDDGELAYFRADQYAACAEDLLREIRPGTVLIGSTALGRSLAPRLATRFRTGLTADCTQLELRENGDLVQIRPAFGGNIMAQIVTPDTRPQFATVRYKVMQALERNEVSAGELIERKLPGFRSAIRLISTSPVPKSANISDAEIIVAAGRGVKKEGDLGLIRALANLLGGEHAVSRPLAEKGWESSLRQIGLSGRTVRPKLLLAFGISGAIQFTSCMSASERIVAVNTDPEAPIFRVAHIGIVADWRDVADTLIQRLRGAKQ